MDSVIAKHPPNDGREWDCCCARCGSSVLDIDCDQCDDGYVDHDCGEDCCCCADPEPNVVCDCCGGDTVSHVCCSDADWCQAHPAKGRENVKRGAIEWFTFDEPENDHETGIDPARYDAEHVIHPEGDEV